MRGTNPIEDATVAWPEETSQYQEVARLILPVQTAWDQAKDAFVEPLSFSPDHSLAAHQPLGSINRARRAAYAALAATRRAESQPHRGARERGRSTGVGQRKPA